MTALEESLADYLRIRRRLGFEMPQDGRLLEGFVEFLDQAGASRITTELALAWARLPVDAHPHRWRQRLSVARGFARHQATIDPTSEVPSTDLLPGHRPRIAPYIYTDAEIGALMAAARQLRPRLRGVRHATLIGLLAVTGMRPGEAVGLDRHDVDLNTGVVRIRAGKQKKQREVLAARDHHQRAARLRPPSRRLSPGAFNAGVLRLRQRPTHGTRGTQPHLHQAGPRGRLGRQRRSDQTPTS